MSSASQTARAIRTLIVISAAFVLVSACKGEKARVYTVEELMADEEQLARMIVQCRDNPGELRSTPNCMNAEAADGKARLRRMNKALGG